MLVGDGGAQEPDGAEVFQRLDLQDRGHESGARIFQGQQRAIRLRHGPEETGLGIGEGLYFAVRNLEAEQVRHAGVVRAAVQIAAIGREHEALGYRLPEIELGDGLELARCQRFNREHAQVLLAVDLFHGGRKQLAVR